MTIQKKIIFLVIFLIILFSLTFVFMWKIEKERLSLLMQDERTQKETTFDKILKLRGESLATFAIFLVLMWFRKRKTGVGQVAWLYLVLYALVRFVIEFFRGDNPQIFMGLTLSQVIGVLALIAAVPLAYVIWFSPAQSDGSAVKRSGQ